MILDTTDRKVMLRLCFGWLDGWWVGRLVGWLAGWFNLFNAELPPKSYWRGPRFLEVGVG